MCGLICYTLQYILRGFVKSKIKYHIFHTDEYNWAEYAQFMQNTMVSKLYKHKQLHI